MADYNFLVLMLAFTFVNLFHKLDLYINQLQDGGTLMSQTGKEKLKDELEQMIDEAETY